ncbi:MAG: arylamine N-acetyltransferase [Ktedonobacterales bacterium]
MACLASRSRPGMRRSTTKSCGAEATWLLQRSGEAGLDAQYRLTMQPRVMADFAARCNYQQTSPESHFTQRRICSLALPDGRITPSGLRLITTLDGVRDERELASEDEYRTVLAEQFGVTLQPKPMDAQRSR